MQAIMQTKLNQSNLGPAPKNRPWTVLSPKP